MIYNKGPCRLLIVSGNEKGGAALAELLDPAQFAAVSHCRSGSDCRRLLLGAEFDIVIINTPLPDEFGRELAFHLAESTACGVMLIVKNECFDETCYDVEDAGIVTVAKPLSRLLFHQALKLLLATRERLRLLERENARLQVRIEEIRVVDRAKYALIEYLKMSEAQAHRYIEKRAMDMRLTKREVAESILRTYEE